MWGGGEAFKRRRMSSRLRLRALRDCRETDRRALPGRRTPDITRVQPPVGNQTQLKWGQGAITTTSPMNPRRSASTISRAPGTGELSGQVRATLLR